MGDQLKAFPTKVNDGAIPAANVEEARALGKKLGDDFSFEGMQKISEVMCGMTVWAVNIIMYYDVMSQKPKVDFKALQKEAVAALDVLDAADVDKLKAMESVPPAVEAVAVILMHLLAGVHSAVDVSDGKPASPNWDGAKKMLSAADFFDQLKAFPTKIDDGAIPAANVEEARALGKKLGDDFSFEGMQKISEVMCGMTVWSVNIIMYYDVMSQKPKD